MMLPKCFFACDASRGIHPHWVLFFVASSRAKLYKYSQEGGHFHGIFQHTRAFQILVVGITVVHKDSAKNTKDCPVSRGGCICFSQRTRRGGGATIGFLFLATLSERKTLYSFVKNPVNLLIPPNQGSDKCGGRGCFTQRRKGCAKNTKRLCALFINLSVLA